MARYLLIEFAEDDAADKMRAMVDEQTRKGKRFRVAGIFARPKGLCECPTPQGYKKNLVAVGKRFGWNVCVACKRAKKGSHAARNLLTMGELMRMSGDPIAGVYEYRADNVGIFEVPVKNIKGVE